MSQEGQLTEHEHSRQRNIVANDECRTKRDQSLDEDFIPGSSDEESSDGSPSSDKCELKKGKQPKKITVVEKKRPATGNYAPQLNSFCNIFWYAKVPNNWGSP